MANQAAIDKAKKEAEEKAEAKRKADAEAAIAAQEAEAEERAKAEEEFLAQQEKLKNENRQLKNKADEGAKDVLAKNEADTKGDGDGDDSPINEQLIPDEGTGVARTGVTKADWDAAFAKFRRIALAYSPTAPDEHRAFGHGDVIFTLGDVRTLARIR